MDKYVSQIKRFTPHLIAIAIFLIISAIYVSPSLSGKVMDVHDLETWQGMSKEVVDHRSEKSEEALWTKRMFSGMPAYQISTKSQNNLIQYVDKFFQLGLPRPMDMIFLYLIGFYILLVTLKIDFRLAIVGSIAFAFSSYFMIILAAGHMTKAHAIAYMPLIVAFVLYTYREKRWLLGSILTSLFLALQLYSNHYQITYYTLMILFFIGVVQFFKEYRNKNIVSFSKRSGALVLAGLLAAATNYTRISTTMEYGPETQRGKSELTKEDRKKGSDGLSFETITNYSYGISETMTLLIPNFKGGAKLDEVPKDAGIDIFQDEKGKSINPRVYWGDNGADAPTYVGAIIVFLFILGVLIVRSSMRRWILLSIILSLMLSWGKNLEFVTHFFMDYVPAYNKFRAVTMAMVIAQFGIALLAILALNKFLNTNHDEEKTKKFKLAFYISAGLCLIFALFPSIFLDFKGPNDSGNPKNMYDYRESILTKDAWRSFAFIFLSAITLWFFIKEKIKKQYVIVIMGSLILIDLYAVDKRYFNDSHFIDDNKVGIKESEADRYIESENLNMSRVLDLGGETKDLRKNPQESPADFLNRKIQAGIGKSINSSRASYFHNSIGGYHAAKLMRYNDLTTTFSIFRPSILSMLNCEWVIYPSKKEGIGPKAYRWDDSKLNSYRNFFGSSLQPPLGNAWFIKNVNFVKNADDEFSKILAIDFNPSETVYIDNRYRDLIPVDNFLNYKEDKAPILDHESYQPNKLEYNFTSPTQHDQLAVFSEIYYEKGWNAYIDNKLTPHFRVNYILRGLIVPQGTKQIVFEFRPKSYEIGEKVALASSVLLLLLLAFVSYKEIRRV